MPRLILFVLLSFWLGSFASAQPLVVTSATPTDYASGVALSTQIAFTFSEPLVDISQGFGSAPTLLPLPNEAVEITDTEQSADGRTVTYSLTLQADTRYVFLMLDATAAGGEHLARPFALNLTTSARTGSFTVQGTVDDASARSLDGTLVALVSGDLVSGAITFAGATVLEGESGVYSVGPAPLGLYTVGAVRLPFVAGAISPEALGFGFYDRNGDGAPDPVFVSSGVDVTIAPPDPITAAERYQSAADAASGELAVPDLIGIDGPQVGTDGRASLWRYSFQGQDAVSKLDIVQVGPFALPLPSINDVTGIQPLPVPFVDSDAALLAAEASGGSAFRSRNSPRTVTVSMQASPPLTAGEPALWTAQYGARDTEDGPDLDALTVTVPFEISTASTPAPEASGVSIRLASPNPTAGEIRVVVTSPDTRDLRLDILDARGRIVQHVFHGNAVGGERIFAVSLDASLASGRYGLRLLTPEATVFRPFVLSR